MTPTKTDRALKIQTTIFYELLKQTFLVSCFNIFPGIATLDSSPAASTQFGIVLLPDDIDWSKGLQLTSLLLEMNRNSGVLLLPGLVIENLQRPE